MEYRKQEAETVAEIAVQKEVIELGELQLTLVGGGIGETTL